MEPETSSHSDYTKDTQDADVLGLPGRIDRPTKITMLGAGRFFIPRLVNDISKIPGQQGGEIALVDIDSQRLGTMKQLIERLIAQSKCGNWKVVASPNRSLMMKGSDHIWLFRGGVLIDLTNAFSKKFPKEKLFW